MAAELSEICDIKKKLFLYHFPSCFFFICYLFRLISGSNEIGMFAIGIIIGRIESHKNSAININGANRSSSIVSIKQIFRICSLEYSSVYIYIANTGSTFRGLFLSLGMTICNTQA